MDRAREMAEGPEIRPSGCQVGITVRSVGLGLVAEPTPAVPGRVKEASKTGGSAY